MTWVRTRATAAGVVVGVVLLVVGALLGRPDVAVLGAAPLVAGVWDWRRRPALQPTVRLEPSAAPVDAGTLRAEVAVESPGTALVGVPFFLLKLRRLT